MAEGIPTFEDFVRPLIREVDTKPLATTPLSQLPVGDYAVLAWLDEAQARYSPAVEADLVAHWDTATLRDVYAMLFADTPGAEST